MGQIDRSFTSEEEHGYASCPREKMGRILRARFSRGDRIEDLIAQVMGEARRRTGMNRAQFAHAINRTVDRNAGLLDTIIEAYEDGAAIPVADVYHGALALAGLDVRDLLTRFLDRAVPVLLPLTAVDGRHVVELTAAISPWW